MNHIQARYYKFVKYQIIKKHFDAFVTPILFNANHLNPMRKLLNNSACFYSTVSPSVAIQKGYFFQVEFRKIGKVQQVKDFFQKHKQDINKYAKTIYLQFLLQFHISSVRKSSQDEQIAQLNKKKDEYILTIYKDLESLTNLNFYEEVLRFSIFKKMQYTFGYTNQIGTLVCKYREIIHSILDINKFDIIDGLNILSIYGIQMQETIFQFACQLIEREILQIEQIPYKSGNILLKRFSQGDWKSIRKFQNILKYFCFKGSINVVNDKGQTLHTLLRLCQLQLHLVGPRCIPKKIDYYLDFLTKQISQLHDYEIYKIFECFKYLPLNYNAQVFQKIKNHMMKQNKINIKFLQFLPYDRLTVKQIQQIEEKIVNLEGNHIFLKNVYYFYQPYYKKLFTNKFRKDCYYAMLDVYTKEDFKCLSNIAVYIGFIEKFLDKIELYPYIKYQMLLSIFKSVMKEFVKNINNINQILSMSSCISLLEIVHKFGMQKQFDFNSYISKLKETTLQRKYRFKFNNFKNQVAICLMSHYNAKSPLSQDYLVFLLEELLSFKSNVFRPIWLKDKADVIFSIQKSQTAKQKFQKSCQKLFNTINSEDYPAFFQLYIKYEYKNWKLSNYIFQKMYIKKISLKDWINTICVIPIRFLVMKTGNLNIYIKNYINQVIQQKNYNTIKSILKDTDYENMILLLRNLSNFNEQVKQFNKILVKEIVSKLSQSLKQKENINGKQVTIFVTYCTKVLKDFNVQQREEVTANILNILQTLRKSGKQGLYMKVFYLNFCYSNQQFVKIDEDLLYHMSHQVIQTLQNTRNIQNKIDIVLIILKIQCLKSLLSNQQIKQFKHIALEAIESHLINSTHLKQIFQYQFKNAINNQQQTKKIANIIGDIMKNAYRKDLLKEKTNQFIQIYYLQFFSFIGQKEMIIQNFTKNAKLGFSSGYMRSLLSVFKKIKIKNLTLTKNIVKELVSSTQYKLQQKYQAYFFIQSLFYSFDCPEYRILKKTLYQDMKKNIILHKQKHQSKTQKQKKIENKAQQTQQTQQTQIMSANYQQLDRYLKRYVDYGWSMLKNKQIDEVFSFIIQFLIKNSEKIEKYLLQNQNHKNISKTKLSSLIMYGQHYMINVKNYLKDIQPNQNRNDQYKLKLIENAKRLAKILHRLYSQNNLELQKLLNEKSLKFTFKNKHGPFVTQYQVQKILANEIQAFGVITMKPHHKSSINQINQYKNDVNLNKITIFNEEKLNTTTEPTRKKLFKSKQKLSSSSLSASSSSPPRMFLNKQQNWQKPLSLALSQQIKSIEIQKDLAKQQQSNFLQINGNLKAQKSLFELMTNKKCLIFDPQTKKFYN